MIDPIDCQISRRRTVCYRCAKIKQACDGGSPCSRCKRLQVVCEPNVKADARSSSEGSNLVASKRVKITRTHNGCLTCKKRRRKCDEAKPRCSSCRRLCLDCKYSDSLNEAAKLSSSSPSIITNAGTVTQSPPEVIIDSLSPPDIRFQSQGSEDGTASNFLDPNMLDESAGDSSSWDDFTEFLSVTSHSQPSVHAPETGSTPLSIPDLSLSVLSTAPDIATDEDRSLLNHYVKVVAGVLSRRDDRRCNPYLTKVLPMAFSNQLVMDAVLALSASHWKKLQPSLWKRGTIHQTNALQSLAKLLPHIQNDSADAALSATLLLCMIELFDGTSSHWKFHLDGARRLLSAFDQKTGWSQQTEFRAFYRQLYHYLDSATTISTCHPPLLEPQSKENSNKAPKSCTSSGPRYDTNDEEALYGVPKSLFHFVDKINSLAYQRKFRDDAVFETMFQASAASLEKELEKWRNEHVNNNEKLQESDSNLLLDFAPDKTAAAYYAAIAFEQALQLRLHQVVNGYSLEHENVKRSVKQILDAIQEIRYGNPLESSLVFPLVMAGSSCSTEGERMIIRDRFMVMERTLGFRYIYTAHELVQKVWQQRDLSQGTDTQVNWAAIRYFEIPGLAFV